MVFFPLKPAGTPMTAALVASTSTAEIVLGFERKFLFVCSTATNIEFGNSGMVAATTSNGVLVPANTPMVFTTGSHFDRVRLISTGVGPYYIQPLEG